MSVTLFFDLKLKGTPYERIAHKVNENDFSTYTVQNLKKIIVGELLKDYQGQVELVYCGNVLDDSAQLVKEGIKPGCTIHVFSKPEPESIALTEEEDTINSAISVYRKHCIPYKLPKVISDQVYSQILEKYPQFYNDSGAFAILKDRELLGRMMHPTEAHLIGKEHPILAKAAKFIADAITNHLANHPPSSDPTSADYNSDATVENDDDGDDVWGEMSETSEMSE